MASERILFVDDDPVSRRAFARAMRKSGFIVDLAQDGDEAWELATHFPYAVIATDLRMPGMDGMMLIDQMRELQPDTVCLLVTGCKQLESFKPNARGPLQTSCGGCHANAANGNARGAMDITGVASTDDAVLQNVCNQARTRINFQDTNASGFYIAPNPAMATSHPFKFNQNQANFDAFKAAVDVWVQAEKTSQ